MEKINIYLDLLSKYPLFEGIKKENIENAVSEMNGFIKNYEKNEFLHTGYTKLSHFGIVLLGNVEVCVDDFGGNKMIMAQVGVGNSFGESICFLKIPNSPVYVTATEKTTVLWLDITKLFDKKSTETNEIIKYNFTKKLALRPLEMNKRIQVLSKLKLREKITAFLSELPIDRDKKMILVPLNREDMATYIGTNRTALSRELSLMKKEGILDYKKNVFIIK